VSGSSARLSDVTTRAATWEDEAAVVELLTRLARRRAIEWALSPAAGDRGVVERLHRWNVNAMLATGTIQWNGTALAGGRPLRLGPAAKLRYGLVGRERRGVRHGRHSLPDIPVECQRRLVALSRAALPLRPPGRTFLLQAWGSVADAEGLHDAVRSLRERAGRARVFATTAVEDPGGPDLAELGFVATGEVAAGDDGRPALTGWSTHVT
jgi:hypothetical protein